MSVVIVDYGSGNLHSAAKAFERARDEAGLSLKIHVTQDPGKVAGAARVVLPGVGAYADCHAGLVAIDGMMDALSEVVLQKKRPFLGICVGMQLLANHGLEHGRHRGFGWIDGEVRALVPQQASLKIPHMGWNTLSFQTSDQNASHQNGGTSHPLLHGISPGANGQHAYFVHSYQFQPSSKKHILATTEYGGAITAMVGQDNIAGTQFHPEKSQGLGLRLIKNFLTWTP